MERLTKVLENGQVVMQCDKCSRRGTIKCDALPCRNMVKDRLGAIEYILGEDYDLDRIRDFIPIHSRYAPNPAEHALYNHSYEIFKKLYAANKDNFRLLRRRGEAHA